MKKSIKNLALHLFIIWNVLFVFIIANISRQNSHRRDFVAGDNHFIIGKIIHIFDGNTYVILIGGSKTICIRIEGIDAPEKGMPYRNELRNIYEICGFKKTTTQTNRNKSTRQNAGFYLFRRWQRIESRNTKILIILTLQTLLFNTHIIIYYELKFI